MVASTTAAAQGAKASQPAKSPQPAKGSTGTSDDPVAILNAIYARAAHRMDASVVITCDRGIRWGLAHERAPAARA